MTIGTLGWGTINRPTDITTYRVAIAAKKYINLFITLRVISKG